MTSIRVVASECIFAVCKSQRLIDGSMTGSLILEMTYGMKVQLENDPYIEIAEKGSEGLERSVSASNLVDMFPWCKLSSSSMLYLN